MKIQSANEFGKIGAEYRKYLNDKSMLIIAGAKAQKAVNYMLGKKEDFNDKTS